MSITVKLRRGTTTQHSTFTGEEAEVTVDTTKDVVVVHDGVTAGGHPMAKASDLATVAFSGDYNDLSNLPTAGTGTVSSVDLSAPLGFSVSGNPITTSGTLALSFASGYALPTTTKQSQWDTSYGWGNHASAGYLTSYTETDPIYTASSWYTTTNNSGNWDTAYGWGNHASAGYLDSADIGVTVQGYNANTVIDAAYVHTDNNFTTTEQSKLAGIAAGAEVNVNADWSAVSGDAQILNKPTLGTAAATDSTDYATAAQGVKADSALQPAAIGTTVQAYSASLTSLVANPTSAGLATFISDETGSGALVFGTAPTLSAPLIDGANPYIQFNNGSAVTVAAGRIWYDGSKGSWNAGMGGGNITQQLGEELFEYGKASSAITDSPLQIIYQTGTVGASGVITFAPTVSGITDGDLIIGVATESIALNGFGRITSWGNIHGVTTDGAAFGETWADNDVIWYNPVTGNPTKVKPVAPNIKVSLGTVIKAGADGSGTFKVEINHGSVLGGTDSNVQLTSVANYNLLQYDSTGGYWKNVTGPAGAIVGSTDTQTLSNKNIQERVVVITDATSITINADTTDLATQANTQATGTLTINSPTGTPVNGQKLMLRLQSTNVQTFSWNAIFAGSTDLPLPTASTGSSKYDYVGFVYNSTAAKWQMIAKNFGF